MPIDPTTYRAGDQYRVVGLPASINSSGSFHFKNGDVVTLRDPPTMAIPPLVKDHFGLETDVALRIESRPKWIPAEWVALISLPHPVCQCDLMATGCVCGVFRAEQARNLSLTKDDQGPT